MSFLTNIVADLLQESTGLKSRRMLRRIGTKRLVMAAGALAAGAYAADKLSNRGTPSAGGSSGVSPSQMTGRVPASTPPPPPPPPGAASLHPPPPPPPPAGGEATPEATEAALEALPPEVTYAAVRAMVAAAAADGEIAEAERRAIHQHLADSDLSAEQRQRVEAEFDRPASAVEIAASVLSSEAGVVVFELATAVTGSDGEVSPAEQAFLAELRAALP